VRVGLNGEDSTALANSKPVKAVEAEKNSDMIISRKKKGVKNGSKQ
jgi:hypothetical protein